MAQWGKERNFEGENATIRVIPDVDTGPTTFNLLSSAATIEEVLLLDWSGDGSLALFEQVKEQFEGQPYASWLELRT